PKYDNRPTGRAWSSERRAGPLTSCACSRASTKGRDRYADSSSLSEFNRSRVRTPILVIRTCAKCLRCHERRLPLERLLVWAQIDLVRPGTALLGVQVPVVIDDRIDLEQAVGAGLLGPVRHARQQAVALDAAV